MRALADDFAFIQHYDLLGVHDGGNALRDDEHDSVFRVFRQRTAQLCIRFEIERGEAIIENIHRRFFHERTGSGKALLLAAGNVAAALRNGAFHAVRQLAEKIP